MSQWNAGQIKQVVAKHPFLSTIAYGALSYVAMKLAVSPALISIMGGITGMALSAIPVTQNSDMSRSRQHNRILAAGVVGALIPSASFAVATYEGFKTSRLFARRGARAYQDPTPNSPSQKL